MNSASCSRPTCSGKPAAWLAYDYGARCAWIDDPIDDSVEGPADRSSRWPLCTHHANTLQVPRGWSRVDRRAPLGQQSLDGPGFNGPGFNGDNPEADDPDGGGVVFPVGQVCSRIH
jgi:hypothetical protein